MWVRFVDKQSSGTLFNFGNPLEENGSGFRLETRTNIDGAGNYKRWIRLAVREGSGVLRDNHWGVENRQRRLATENSPIDFYDEEVIHQLYPNIPTEDLNEWYFICATYNPNIIESPNSDDVGFDFRDYLQNKQYWLNHILPTEDGDTVVANSGFGPKCKVEIISRSDLLKARGYKVGDIEQTTIDDSEETQEESPFDVDAAPDIDDLNNPSNEETQEEESPTNPRDVLPEPNVEIPDDIINFGAGGGNY
jgi:hypothetical protein